MNLINETRLSLEANGIQVLLAEDEYSALSQIKDLLPTEKSSIGLGGSVTVEEIGLLDYLLSQDHFVVHNQYEKNITYSENVERRRRGLLADVYITGTNAVTRDGKLVNADGSGNRVAALSFGPKKVIIVIGVNKLVNTVADAFDRINTVAAVKNCERINKKAASLFKDRSYSVQSIANIFSVIERSDEKDRITLVLINKNLGF